MDKQKNACLKKKTDHIVNIWPPIVCFLLYFVCIKLTFDARIFVLGWNMDIFWIRLHFLSKLYIILWFTLKFTSLMCLKKPNVHQMYVVKKFCNEITLLWKNWPHGWDSPTLKLCYLCLWLVLFQFRILLEEKSVIVELDESKLWCLIGLRYLSSWAQSSKLFHFKPSQNVNVHQIEL
jgi:hypothetical protein